MYEVGKRLFFFRGGPYDFACAILPRRGRQAHPPAGPAEPDAEPRRRRRLRRLAGLPRVSGELWGMQRRLNDCYRQQRFPVSRLRVRRDDRARRLHGRQQQGRRVDRAVAQAMRTRTMKITAQPAAVARERRARSAAPVAPTGAELDRHARRT